MSGEQIRLQVPSKLFGVNSWDCRWSDSEFQTVTFVDGAWMMAIMPQRRRVVLITSLVVLGTGTGT